MNKKSVLLINLGTPDHNNPLSVYRYLTKFLNDRRVVDLPHIIRWPLVNCVIVPSRYRQSAKAYASIWQETGSPLSTNSVHLKNALSHELGPTYHVELGMRYGNPSIQFAINQLHDCQELVVVPLFPHYSSAATGSALTELMKQLSNQWNMPSLSIKKDFYCHSGFINAYAEIIKDNLADKQVDLLLFSYHGLPERHIEKSGCKASCDKQGTCPQIGKLNNYCYRAQCYETSRLLANAIDFPSSRYEIAFQSRLGRTPWIKPYTDLLLPTLIRRNIKRLAVVCPSFVADCLETLEEINIRLRKQWLAQGGEEFIFIPSLNTHPLWVKTLSDIVKNPS